jgi:hypothetical protein
MQEYVANSAFLAQANNEKNAGSVLNAQIKERFSSLNGAMLVMFE